MTDTYSTYLASIRANPDNLMTYRVLADLIEEEGRPGMSLDVCANWAAMIREMADEKFAPEKPDFKYLEFENRYRPALQAIARKILPMGIYANPTKPRPDIDLFNISRLLNHVGIRCGFIDTASLQAHEWVKYADRILAEHPVREVRLTTPHARPQRTSMDIYTWDDGVETSIDDIVHIAKYGGAGQIPTLNARWPGIKFHLPETATFGPRRTGAIGMPTGRIRDFARDIDEMAYEQNAARYEVSIDRYRRMEEDAINQLVQGLGIPPHLVYGDPDLPTTELRPGGDR